MLYLWIVFKVKSIKNLLGFAEDCKKVVLNCKHELVLMLTKNLGVVFEQTEMINL